MRLCLLPRYTLIILQLSFHIKSSERAFQEVKKRVLNPLIIFQLVVKPTLSDSRLTKTLFDKLSIYILRKLIEHQLLWHVNLLLWTDGTWIVDVVSELCWFSFYAWLLSLSCHCLKCVFDASIFLLGNSSCNGAWVLVSYDELIHKFWNFFKIVFS